MGVERIGSGDHAPGGIQEFNEGGLFGSGLWVGVGHGCFLFFEPEAVIARPGRQTKTGERLGGGQIVHEIETVLHLAHLLFEGVNVAPDIGEGR